MEQGKDYVGVMWYWFVIMNVNCCDKFFGVVDVKDVFNWVVIVVEGVDNVYI